MYYVCRKFRNWYSTWNIHKRNSAGVNMWSQRTRTSGTCRSSRSASRSDVAASHRYFDPWTTANPPDHTGDRSPVAFQSPSLAVTVSRWPEKWPSRTHMESRQTVQCGHQPDVGQNAHWKTLLDTLAVSGSVPVWIKNEKELRYGFSYG